MAKKQSPPQWVIHMLHCMVLSWVKFIPCLPYDSARGIVLAKKLLDISHRTYLKNGWKLISVNGSKLDFWQLRLEKLQMISSRASLIMSIF